MEQQIIAILLNMAVELKKICALNDDPQNTVLSITIQEIKNKINSTMDQIKVLTEAGK